MAPSTKQHILATALGLFNGQGTGPVSTNHIAAGAGLSPGNLYYHYRNKAEIIRALYGEIEAAWDALYAIPPGRAPDLATLEAMLRGNFEIQWRYRFLFRELPALLQADPALALAYRAGRARGFEGFRGLLDWFSATDVLRRPATAEEVDDIAQMLWLVGDFWLVFNEVGGVEIGEAQMAQGVRIFRRILTPYIQGDLT